jgi:hypothetical protein
MTFFLIVSALVPYKRVDLAIETFNRMQLPLVIVGTGPERRWFSGDARAQTDGGRPYASPVWHNGPERPLHRPSNPEDQEEYYSGKKKCYTVKNILVIDETCRICLLSPTYEGKANDKSLANMEGYTLPRGSCLYQDMGFQGYTRGGDHDCPTQEKSSW